MNKRSSQVQTHPGLEALFYQCAALSQADWGQLWQREQCLHHLGASEPPSDAHIRWTWEQSPYRLILALKPDWGGAFIPWLEAWMRDHDEVFAHAALPPLAQGMADQPQPYLYLSAEGVVLSANQAATALIAPGTAPLSGGTLPQLLGEDPGLQIWHEIRQAHSQGPIKCIVTTTDTTLRAFRIKAQWDPTYEGYHIYIDDISSKIELQQRLQQALEKFEMAVSGSGAEVWEVPVKPTGLMGDEEVEISPWFKRLLGYEPHEMSNSRSQFRARIHPADNLLIEERIKACFAGQRNYEATYRIRHRDGTWRWVHSQGALIRDAQDQPYRFSGLSWDLTPIKVVEEELRAVVATRDRFISWLAHDLRGPLASQATLYHLLLDDFTTLLAQPDTLRQQLKVMASVTQRTHEMLEHMLLWGRGSQGELTCTPSIIPLQTLLTAALDIWQAALLHKQIRVRWEMETDAALWADPQWLGTIVHNLLSNAIKFSAPEGEITLHSQSVPGGATLTIADQGVGIPAEILGQIGQLEVKHSRLGTHGEKGSGLGLLLCQALMQQHQGSLTIDSRPGEGTKVTLFFPEPARLTQA